MAFQIQYPQTLIDMWYYAHPENGNNKIMSTKQFNDAFEELKQMLIGYCKNQKMTWTPEDYVIDYITDLLTKNGPEPIASHTYLIRDFRNFLVTQANPVSKELSDIEHEALLALEKEGKIKRDKESQGKNISRWTFFALTDYQQDEIAVFDDYELNANKVPCYSVKLRAGNAEKTRLLSPQNAKELILCLLKAFGKWTNNKDLFDAMKRHIPDQFCAVKVVDKEGNDRLENIPDPNTVFSAKDFEEFYTEQADLKSSQLSERIWDEIKKVSVKVFCLYYLPNEWFNKSTTMASVGTTSTVSDQNKKIQGIVRTELAGFYKDFQEYGYLDMACKRIMQIIPAILKGRCTENNYNPDLL